MKKKKKKVRRLKDLIQEVQHSTNESQEEKTENGKGKIMDELRKENKSRVYFDSISSQNFGPF